LPIEGGLGTLAGPTRVGGKFPVSGRLVVSKDVHIPVICVDFEPALRWRKPAIDYATHGKPALAEPESERLLFTAIAGVALHTNRHVLTIPLKPVQSPVLPSCPNTVRIEKYDAE
jgi:hypothetical protein